MLQLNGNVNEGDNGDVELFFYSKENDSRAEKKTHKLLFL